MKNANSMYDDGSPHRVLETAIAYADWILGGPSPHTQTKDRTTAQSNAANSKANAASPIASLAFLPVPCLVSGERIFPFGGEMILVGREAKATICIDKSFVGWETVSPCHARLMPRKGRWLIRDGYADDDPSENGIYVNGKRTRVNYLADHWTIGFGQVEFRFYTTVALAQQARARGLSNVLACPNCGGVNGGTALFCKECGRALSSISPLRANVMVNH